MKHDKEILALEEILNARKEAMRKPDVVVKMSLEQIGHANWTNAVLIDLIRCLKGEMPKIAASEQMLQTLNFFIAKRTAEGFKRVEAGETKEWMQHYVGVLLSVKEILFSPLEMPKMAEQELF